METGTTVPATSDGLFPPEVDFYLGWVDRSTSTQVLLIQNYPAEVAFFDETIFYDLDLALASGVTFTQSVIDQPLDHSDTVLIRTAEGNLYKLGLVHRHGSIDEFQLDYELLEAAAPPAGWHSRAEWRRH